MKTKTINKIKINEKVYKKIFNIYIEEKINKALKKYNEFLEQSNKLLSSGWIKITDLDIYYVAKEKIFVMFENIQKNNSPKEIIDFKELNSLFIDENNDNPFIKEENIDDLLRYVGESREYILNKMSEVNKNPEPFIEERIKESKYDKEEFLLHLKTAFYEFLNYLNNPNPNDIRSIFDGIYSFGRKDKVKIILDFLDNKYPQLKNKTAPEKNTAEYIYYENKKTQWVCYEKNDKLEVFNINTKTIREDVDNISSYIKVYKLKMHKKETLFETLISNEFIPEIFNDNNTYKEIMYNYKNKNIIFKNNNIILSVQCINKIKQGKLHITINKEKNALDEFEKYIKNNITEEYLEPVLEDLLNTDKKRVDIDAYDRKILEDPNRGHWDLWNQEFNDNDTIIETNKNLIARNPLNDINEDGTIAIDFGTKSTIVVSQGNTENIMPIRIGTGNLSKKINSKQYENPTVIEFIDLQDFMKRYNSKNGRPETLWEDLTISHTAFNDLIKSDSSEYYSYFYNLKQWAGGKEGKIRIRDKKNFDVVIPSYLELKEEDIDPIEIYAYNLGLYINNMRQGIFLDYILSFPVTYEKAVREKILNSFSKGIKKSLPVEVLNDEDCMKKFRVIQGASEPAAYAVCALQEYNFEPEDDEKIFYGIFDFGGGTTDFDFGIWREANEKESRYDYVINHFGAGGDRYLGGENLLELLAFEVFKENQDKLREKGITFLLPEECERFAGSEVLISESQEAKLNTKQLMEYLRCFWEKEEGYEKKFESGKIKIALFTKDGKREANFELDINTEILETILRNRIEKGVKNFFESLKLAFAKENIKDVKNVLIFLAGNSSKSSIVKELFEKYIKEETEDIIKYNKIEAGEYFKIYPPLGTEEAYKIQEDLGIKVCRDDITKPTGKTGVAFGLIDCIPGSNIKVISEKNIEEEIKFKYYVGHNKKRRFFVDINRDVDYNKWILFTDSSCEDFQIYYTTEPQASSNNMPINEVKKKKCRIDVIDENANVYVRAVGPSEIEYVVATEDEIIKNKYISQLVKLKLE